MSGALFVLLVNYQKTAGCSGSHIDQYTFLTLFEEKVNQELQVRGGIEDNSKIIFLISQRKHIML